MKTRYLFSDEEGFDYYQVGSHFFKTKSINTDEHIEISVGDVCMAEQVY